MSSMAIMEAIFYHPVLFFLWIEHVNILSNKFEDICNFILLHFSKGKNYVQNYIKIEPNSIYNERAAC